MLRNTTHLILLSLATITVIDAPACNGIECGTGTIERDGTCQPGDGTFDPAKCGAFTMLVGDQCVPMFPPTICDPGSTMSSIDGSTGVTTCIGTGVSAGCSGAFACGQPQSGKQTICGQIYNFTDNSKFAAPNATGTRCTTPTSSGPCALQIQAYDAFAYAGNQATPAQTVGDVYIDDCGRYRVTDITPPGGPYIALGFDDAGQPFGPGGVTVTTGVALPTAAGTATPGFEAWVADQTTVNGWAGPSISTGIYAAIFRTHMCDQTTGLCDGTTSEINQAGVTFTKSGMAFPANDYYFQDQATHVDLDPAATATSSNGTALYVGALVTDNLAYGGIGGLADPTNCQWEPHAAASIPGLLFLQIYRPAAKPLKTCSQ